MSWLCKIKHKWYRLPEPNQFECSIRFCRRCGLTQRWNPHGGFRGHWMDDMVGLEQWKEELEKIKKEVK